jgi:hypothetical protein
MDKDDLLSLVQRHGGAIHRVDKRLRSVLDSGLVVETALSKRTRQASCKLQNPGRNVRSNGNRNKQPIFPRPRTA